MDTGNVNADVEERTLLSLGATVLYTEETCASVEARLKSADEWRRRRLGWGTETHIGLGGWRRLVVVVRGVSRLGSVGRLGLLLALGRRVVVLLLRVRRLPSRTGSAAAPRPKRTSTYLPILVSDLHAEREVENAEPPAGRARVARVRAVLDAVRAASNLRASRCINIHPSRTETTTATHSKTDSDAESVTAARVVGRRRRERDGRVERREQKDREGRVGEHRQRCLQGRVKGGDEGGRASL